MSTRAGETLIHWCHFRRTYHGPKPPCDCNCFGCRSFASGLSDGRPYSNAVPIGPDGAS